MIALGESYGAGVDGILLLFGKNRYSLGKPFEAIFYLLQFICIDRLYHCRGAFMLQLFDGLFQRVYFLFYGLVFNHEGHNKAEAADGVDEDKYTTVSHLRWKVIQPGNITIHQRYGDKGCQSSGIQYSYFSLLTYG